MALDLKLLDALERKLEHISAELNLGFSILLE